MQVSYHWWLRNIGSYEHSHRVSFYTALSEVSEFGNERRRHARYVFPCLPGNVSISDPLYDCDTPITGIP